MNFASRLILPRSGRHDRATCDYWRLLRVTTAQFWQDISPRFKNSSSESGSWQKHALDWALARPTTSKIFDERRMHGSCGARCHRQHRQDMSRQPWRPITPLLKSTAPRSWALLRRAFLLRARSKCVPAGSLKNASPLVGTTEIVQLPLEIPFQEVLPLAFWY